MYGTMVELFPQAGAHLARWCFAKRDSTLDAAGDRLLAWAAGKNSP